MNAMQKLVARRNAARKLGKKGFTLVELIIVIAIIAALVAVLAPQYIKYLDKSRDAALESAANDVLTIAKTEAALGHFTKAGTITVSSTGIGGTAEWAESGTTGVAVSSTADGSFTETMIGDTSDMTKSKSTKSFTINVTATDATKGWTD